MIGTHRFAIAVFILTLSADIAPAQVTTGTPPFGSFGGGPDIINLANLNSHITVPVLHKTGRAGQNFTYDLSYDTSVWYPAASTWQPLSNWGWRGVTEAETGSTTASGTSNTCQICNPFTCWYPVGQIVVSNWVYHDPWGVPHPFSGSAIINNGNCPQYGGPNSSGFTSTAADGSGYTLTVTGCSNCTNISQVVTARDGHVMSGPYNSSGGAGSGTDRNGNQITVSSSGVFTDNLGTTALTVAGSGTPASPVTFTYTAPSGASAVYTMKYTTYSIQTNFGCSGITDYGINGTTTANLVSEVDLPEYNVTTNPNARYTLTYESTPGHSGFFTGRLASITLPTGGTISYGYSGGNNGIVCADGSAATLTRTTPDGAWTYAHSESGTAWTTTVTDPQQNQTVLNFQGIYETERQVYQGSTSGTLLRTVYTCYNGSASPCNSTAIGLPITTKTVIVQLPGASNLQSKQVYSYSSYGVPTEVDDYDYGSGAPPSIPLRKTLISYATLTNIHAFQQTVTIQDGSGTTLSQTSYNYDEGSVTTTSGTPQLTSPAGSRGNLTSIHYPNGSARSITYYDTGNLNVATDINGQPTTYNYGTGSCGNSFPTGISEPLGLSQSYTWNCAGGVLLTMTDENSKITTTAYANDPFYWRPDSVTDPAGVALTFCYGLKTSGTGTCTVNPTQVESTLNFNSNNSTVDTASTVDGLGRTHIQQKRQSPTATSFDSVETDYDSLGRVSRVTLPYSGTAGQTCPSCPATTTTYDALSRIAQITDAGGGTRTYSPYSNNDVFVTVGPAPSGENTKRRQLEYDGLGRLTSVCEITGLSQSGTCGQTTAQTGFWAKYSYDALNDLTGVTQNAQPNGTAQTRSYSFDGMTRLTSETNAESGTTNYTYDTDATCGSSSGDLVKRVDAVGNTTCYAYDALHRVTSIKYPSGPYMSVTTMKVLYYDTSHFNTTYNTKGRLASAGTCQNPTCAGPWITAEDFSYSARGELTDVYEWTTNSGGWYHTTQTYWPHGAPNQLSGLPGLPTITYSPDGEARVSTVGASSGQNPVTGVTYNSGSLRTQVNFGSGDSDIFAYDANTLRMTQFKFNVGTQSQYLNGALTWNANGTLGQLAITDQFNSANTQTCNYSHDDLIRIASSNCGSAANQTFSYDPFGNISKSGSPYTFQPSYSAATNRMTSIAGFTPTYDNNGNVTNDSNHTYSWDADGNSITVDSVGLTFDALDRMVEQNRSGTYTQVVYAPTGAKLALMNGQSLVKAFVPLPGQATAVYTSSGLDHYRHSDWLGSARLTSSPSRAYVSSVAYAPFGETYAQSGTADPSFTGMNPDTVSTDYDFLAREYSNEGRWPSPDPAGLAAVDPSNPRSWNRYSYVLNNAMNFVDPTGLVCSGNIGDSVDTPCNPANDGGGGGSGSFGNYGDFFLMFGNPVPEQVLVGWQVIGVDDGEIILGGCGDFGGSDCFNNEVPVYDTVLTYPLFGLYQSIVVTPPPDMAKELGRALNATGVQTIANPCFVPAFYLTSAGVAGIGVAAASAPATVATAAEEYPSLLNRLAVWIGTRLPIVTARIAGTIALVKAAPGAINRACSQAY